VHRGKGGEPSVRAFSARREHWSTRRPCGGQGLLGGKSSPSGRENTNKATFVPGKTSWTPANLKSAGARRDQLVGNCSGIFQKKKKRVSYKQGSAKKIETFCLMRKKGGGQYLKGGYNEL